VRRLHGIPGKPDRWIGTRRECRLDEFEVDGEELRGSARRHFG